jgi:hypothetical protein
MRQVLMKNADYSLLFLSSFLFFFLRLVLPARKHYHHGMLGGDLLRGRSGITDHVPSGSVEQLDAEQKSSDSSVARLEQEQPQPMLFLASHLVLTENHGALFSLVAFCRFLLRCHGVVSDLLPGWFLPRDHGRYCAELVLCLPAG